MSDDEVRRVMSRLGSARTPAKKAASQETLEKARASRWTAESRAAHGEKLRAAAARKRIAKAADPAAPKQEASNP